MADIFGSVAVVANAAALATAAAAIDNAAAVGNSFVPMLPPLMSRMLLLIKTDCSIKVKMRKFSFASTVCLRSNFFFKKNPLARIRKTIHEAIELDDVRDRKRTGCGRKLRRAVKPSCLSRFCKRILCYKRKISEARRATNIVVLPRQQSRHGGGNLSFQCILACDIKVVRVFGLICCLCVVFSED